MLTSQKVIDAINEQIGYEFSASLQYYAIGLKMTLLHTIGPIS
jgi:ferritin